MSINTTRGLLIQWQENNLINSSIDLAQAAGLNAVFVGVNSEYIYNLRLGQSDPFGAGITYALSKGVKFHIIMSPSDYGLSSINPTATALFLSDMAYILQRYQPLGLAGFVLNNPGQTTADMTFLTTFFTSCKANITAYAPSIEYGVSLNSNTLSGLAEQGIDINAINNNLLFKYIYALYISYNTDGSEQYAFWSTTATNLEKLFQLVIYQNANIFVQVKYAHTRTSPALGIAISYQDVLSLDASNWPADTTPGSTAGEKIKNILSSTVNPITWAGINSCIQSSVIQGNSIYYSIGWTGGTAPFTYQIVKDGVPIGIPQSDTVIGSSAGMVVVFDSSWTVGNHTVAAKISDGSSSYITASCNITVQSATGSLSVDSYPQGATIILNGVTQ